MMNDDLICEYATRFRIAIEKARDTGIFEKDIVFYQFPKGCRGDTSVLLAEFLLMNGIETIYVEGIEGDQSHAWLVVKDDRVLSPTPYITEFPKDIRAALSRYSGKECEPTIINANYTDSDIEEGLIIDITADQFGEPAMYVGYMRDFFRRFSFVEAHDSDGLGSARLKRIYNTIIDFMD